MLSDAGVFELKLSYPRPEDMEMKVRNVGGDHSYLSCLENLIVLDFLRFCGCVVGCHGSVDEITGFNLKGKVEYVDVKAVLNSLGSILAAQGL